jgi:hypothetical protein
MDRPRCRQPSRFKRLIALLRLRRRKPEPFSWPEEPPPDIGVREPRRPRPEGGAGTAILEPPT